MGNYRINKWIVVILSSVAGKCYRSCDVSIEMFNFAREMMCCRSRRMASGLTIQLWMKDVKLIFIWQIHLFTVKPIKIFMMRWHTLRCDLDLWCESSFLCSPSIRLCKMRSLREPLLLRCIRINVNNNNNEKPTQVCRRLCDCACSIPSKNSKRRNLQKPFIQSLFLSFCVN